MPKVNLQFEHGQTYENALINFEKGISEARSRFGTFIRRLEWAEDRTKARLSGPGFEVDLRLDKSMVFVTGHIPIPIGFLEGPIKRFLARALNKADEREDKAKLKAER